MSVVLSRNSVGLRKLADVLRDLGMLARELAELRDEVRIRQEAHIENQVRLSGTPFL